MQHANQSYLSSLFLNAIRHWPASARTLPILTDFVADVAKTFYTNLADQEVFLTMLCTGIETENLVAAEDHSEVQTIVSDPGRSCGSSPGSCGSISDTIVPSMSEKEMPGSAEAAAKAAAEVPAEAAPAPEVAPATEMPTETEKKTFRSLFPAFPKTAEAEQAAEAVADAAPETIAADEGEWTKVESQKLDPAERVRQYLEQAKDIEVTTRDLGRVIRPPPARPGGAPLHMVVWLRKLPFVQILGHSAAGGNIVKLRETINGDPWFYLDTKRHIQGPFTKDDMRAWFEQKMLTPALMIRCGEIGKFNKLATVFPDLTTAFI